MQIISYAQKVAIKGTHNQENVSVFDNDFFCGKRNYDRMKNRIKEWRKKNSMTQEQLAELIGRNKSAVSKLESGKIELTQSMMNLLSRALNCSVENLLAKEDLEKKDHASDFQKNRIQILTSYEKQTLKEISELQEISNSIGFLKICYITGNIDLAADIEQKITPHLRKLSKIKLDENA